MSLNKIIFVILIIITNGLIKINIGIRWNKIVK